MMLSARKLIGSQWCSKNPDLQSQRASACRTVEIWHFYWFDLLWE